MTRLIEQLQLNAEGYCSKCGAMLGIDGICSVCAVEASWDRLVVQLRDANLTTEMVSDDELKRKVKSLLGLFPVSVRIVGEGDKRRVIAEYHPIDRFTKRERSMIFYFDANLKLLQVKDGN